MNGIMAALYVVGILCAAISHGRLDAMLDEHCEPVDSVELEQHSRQRVRLVHPSTGS